MSGLELPAFVVGTSGLIVVFEKSFAVWRTVRAAHGFGEDVANILSMLEMEFFRFQTWWTALQHLALARKSPQHPATTAQSSVLQASLQSNMCQPIIGAAERVLEILEDVEALLRDNGVLSSLEQRPVPPTQTAVSVAYLRSRQEKFADELKKKTPWHKRLLHNMDLWKNESDKALLKSKLDDIIYWNESLYSILPQNLRDSILEIGIAGYVLGIPGDIRSSSGSKRPSRLQQSAILRENRRLISGRQPDPDLQRNLDKTRKELRSLPSLDVASVAHTTRYTVTEYMPEDDDDDECRVLIEWYPYPRNESLDLARERMARIAYLLKAGQGAVNLSTLDAVGYVEDDGVRFGLVLRLPDNTTTSIRPTTLNDLIARKQPPSLTHSFSRVALPALNQRFDLAAHIASSFYSFMLARWHHERFSSLRIAFLLEQPQRGASNLTLDISSPIIGGFEISRPDSIAEISVLAFTPPTGSELLYLHPALREALSKHNTNTAATIKLPRYQRIYDIYAFGLFLAEVGFWNTIFNIARGAASVGLKKNPMDLSPEELKDAVIQKCQDDLACWMGETYRDITVGCLKAGDSGGVGVFGQEDTQELNNFYWDVVVKLLRLPGEA